jgi:hypothetical protein
MRWMFLGLRSGPPASARCHHLELRVAVAVFVALLSSAGTSRAQGEPAERRRLAEPAAEAGVPATPLEQAPLSWSKQPVRWFMSSEIDTGFLYVRPRFSVGYGRPHDLWVGVDTNPIFSSEGVAGYAGLRFDLPYVNLRVGGRYWHTFRRSFLEPQSSYTVEDIELRLGPPSRFLTWEAELTTSVTLGRGSLLFEGAVSYVTGVPDDYDVYEETLRVVVDPPWVWRTRLGYTVALDDDRTIVLGPVLELVGIPRRYAVVYRAGVLARVFISPALEARGTFVPAVITPDPLGARGGDAFLLGIRYRWATGP